MQDCATCPNKDYCIPDECEQLGTKNAPTHGNAKGQIEYLTSKVYHIIKPKGNRTMLELKITVETANELNQEIKDLYQSIVGSSVDKADAIERAKEEVKAKKVKATTKVETPVKREPVKREPVEEEEKQTIPSLEATRAAVKDYIDKAADKTQAKTDFKALLDEIGAEKVSSADDEQRIQIMNWVNSRG